MPKTNAEYCRDYQKKKRRNKIKKTAKSSTERVREFRARRKALLNVKNDSSITHNDDLTIQNSESDHKTDKSRADYMRRYRQCKSEEKLKTAGVNPTNQTLSSFLHTDIKKEPANFMTDNRVEVENYGISIKMEDDSEYDYYGHTEIKEEKWNIENIVKKESDSFLNGQDFEDDYSGSMKVEVKEEPSPTTSDLESEENNDQNSISGAIKTEHPIDDLQSPACSLQAKLPSSLTNCQLPANSALLLIPTVQGTASTVTLLNLNTLSPVNLSSILPNPLPPLVLNAKPGGNQLSVPTGQPFQNKE